MGLLSRTMDFIVISFYFLSPTSCPNWLRFKIALYLFLYLNLSTTVGACTKIGRKRPDMKLELVQTLFRHGERTCDKTEFNIVNYAGLSAYQPWGLGQLTNNGKEQEYKIGQMLRRRYADFFNKNYNSNDVYAYSSEDDRTKMSLQLVLAGLYPPSPEFVWRPALKWIPLPARYTPKELDVLLKPQCNPKFESLRQNVRSTPEYQKRISVHSKLFDIMKEKSGIIIRRNESDIAYAFNALLINKRLNIRLPDWFTDDVEKSLRDLYGFALNSLASTLELKKINGGPIIRTFLENMNVNNTFTNPRRIYLYSGHDLNLYAVKMSLGLESTDYWDFGSGLIMEKWRGVEDRLYVRLLVWDIPGEQPKTLKLNDCEEFCPIDNYMKIIGDVIPSDEEMNYVFNNFDKTKMKELFLGDAAVKL